MSGTLVVYYSHTGFTREIAEEIATAANATVEEIVEARSRTGFLDYLRPGREALTRRTVPIRPASTRYRWMADLIGQAAVVRLALNDRAIK